MSSKHIKVLKVLEERYHAISLEHLDEQARSIGLDSRAVIEALKWAYAEGRIRRLVFGGDVLFYLKKTKARRK